MTDPSPAESAPDRPSGAPWLLASIGTAAIVMGFSWFGGFVSWHDAVAPPFDDSPALTISTFKPHGAKAA
ncbi:MAG: hypothetical protein KGR22_06965, partial [Planctomycetes bacterium]|nr:hypothetical protein [Planctomycetota bacterium]